MSAPAELTKYRPLKGLPRWIFFIASTVVIGLTIIYLWNIVIAGKVILEQELLALLMALLLPLAFFIYPATKRAPRDRVPWYDFALAALGFACSIWLFMVAFELTYLPWAIKPPPIGFVLGLIIWLLVLEGCRRAVGLVFGIIVLFFSCYPLFCQFMPGFLVGKGYSITRTVGFHYLGLDSIFGLPMHVFARLIIGFMVFAVALQVTGGGKFFLNIALALLGRMRGGPAKVSIIASALFGSLSGSVIANVLTTGAITIPTMKRIGYPAEYAGAVETCASTGGVLMPPIMGVTAFIMADFLGISYVSVIIAAAIPSILYYSGLFIQTDFYAAKVGLKGLPQEEIPSLWQTLKEGWMFIFAFVFLMFLLVYMRWESWAPFYAAAILFACAMLRKETRIKVQTIFQFIEGSGRILTELIVILAGVGMIIGSLTLTGLGHAFSRELISLAGGNIALMLGLGAITSAILGIGMTISACYIFLAIVLAPALVNYGFNPLAVHLFIMYWGMISYITPPVALGAYAASGLAGSNPIRTGFRAMRLGAVMYFIPFFFVLQPALVLHGSASQVLLSIVAAGVGILLISGGLERYFPGVGETNLPIAATFIISGILLAYPMWLTTIIGLSIAVVIIGGLLLRKRASNLPSGH